MHIADHLLWASSGLRVIGRVLGGCGSHSGLVVEAVQIAARFLEVFYPFLGLIKKSNQQCDSCEIGELAWGSSVQIAYLGNHHMAIEGASTVCCSRPLNMRTDLGHHGGAKSHIGNEMAIHLAGVSVPLAHIAGMRVLEYDVNMKP